MSRRTIALILSPVGLLLLSAARLLIVANYNTTTAVTIASSGGYINTLLGSIIPLLPVFAPYVALLLLLFRRFLLSIITFVFAAFITPSPISLHEAASLAAADLHHLFGRIPSITQLSWVQMMAIAVVLGIVVSLAVYYQSLAEALSIVVVVGTVVALLLAGQSGQLSAPVPLRLASAGERTNEHLLASWISANWPLTIAVALAIAFFLATYYRSFPGAISTVVAVVATLALLPYVYSIYPVPRHSNYYVEALHQLWLPAERVALSSGYVYYGYVLSESDDWFTVLLTNRTIAYLPVEDVVSRSDCQPQANTGPPPYPPLVPLLYSRPAPTPACAHSDVARALVSVLSRGQSLAKISSALHTRPWRIISITNAREHEQLSAALRRYERARDWNAPTPAGQRFWYFPPIIPPQPHR